MPSSCFSIEQGISGFTDAGPDEERQINFSTAWSTYPTVTVFQSPEDSDSAGSIPMGSTSALEIISGGKGYSVGNLILQNTSSGNGKYIEIEVTAETGNVITAYEITAVGQNYEVGEQIIFRASAAPKIPAVMRVNPLHETVHMNLTITEVTTTYFKIMSSTEWTSTKFHWRAIGKEW